MCGSQGNSRSGCCKERRVCVAHSLPPNAQNDPFAGAGCALTVCVHHCMLTARWLLECVQCVARWQLTHSAPAVVSTCRSAQTRRRRKEARCGYLGTAACRVQYRRAVCGERLLHTFVTSLSASPALPFHHSNPSHSLPSL